MKENNYTKNIDYNFLLALNELPQTKVSVNYLIKKLSNTDTVKYSEEKKSHYYYANYSLCLGLKCDNRTVDTIELERGRHGTFTKIPNEIIDVNEFYKKLLDITSEYTLTDAIDKVMNYPGICSSKYGKEYPYLCGDIEFIREELFKALEKNELYIDFDAVDKKLSSSNYFNEPSINLFMETIKERFSKKINNGQVEGTDVYIDYDELKEILDCVQNELQPKSEIQVKKRAKVRK